MQMAVKRSTGSAKKCRRHGAKARAEGGQNGHVDVISPATASEIRRTLGIGKTQIRNVLRAFEAAGVTI
jgi:hypothetical protein